MMKRVLHVFANLNLGGAESRIMDVYRHIDKNICQFDFLIFSSDDCYFDGEIKELGGKIYRVTHPAENIIKHISDVSKILRSTPFSAIHSHTSYFSGLIMFLAWRQGIPHRVSHARNQYTNRGGIKGKAMVWLGGQLCNIFSTSRLAISRDAAQFLFGKKAKAEVVPNAFEFEKVRLDPRGKVPRIDDSIHMVVVARLSKIKNHVFAIKLTKRISEIKARKVKLHLIGTGSEEECLVGLVKALGLEESVVFWGRREDVKELLCEFDCLLLPSIAEGLGVAVLEGQAAGLPCLVSEGVPHEVDIGLGLVRRLPLDLEKWVQAVDELEINKYLRREEIHERFATLGYSVERTSEIYLKNYGVAP